MSNSKSKQNSPDQKLDDMLAELEELDLWDVSDPADQAFWEEFFKVEDALEMADEFDAPSFTITVQNHGTGETKTYRNIKLKASRKKISC
jgi:hypothetical protein